MRVTIAVRFSRTIYKRNGMGMADPFTIPSQDGGFNAARSTNPGTDPPNGSGI